MKEARTIQQMGSNAWRTILVVALILGTPPAAAGQAGKAKVNGAANAKASSAAKPQGGPQEGIKVHGHWVIEVRNPDGSRVTRREFQNALSQGGGNLLAQWLGRIATPQRWTIEFGGGGPVGPCNGGTESGFPTNSCFIVDPSASPMPTGTAIFPTLTTSIGGANADKVILTGNATAIVQGQIGFVGTRQGSCLSSTAVANCNGAGRVLQFSAHPMLDSQGNFAPISVAQGQIIQVTVTFSFS